MTARGWASEVARWAVLGVMIGCIVLSLVTLAEIFVPDWDGTYLVLFCGLTAVEACLSYRLWRETGAGLPLRGIELGVLFLILQLCVDIAGAQPPVQDTGVPRIDPRTFVLFLPALLCWLAATDAARALSRLAVPSGESAPSASPGQHLARRFFAGGVLLFVVAGLTQAKVLEALNLPAGASSGPVLNVAVYFLLGIVLLGQVRLDVLQRRWRERGGSIAPRLATRWMRQSLLFVGLVALLALLLPMTNADGLLQVARAALGQAKPLAESALSTVMTSVTVLREPLIRLLSLFGGVSRLVHPRHPVIVAHPPLDLPPINVPFHHHGPVRHVRHPTHASAHARGGMHWLAISEALLFWSVLVVGALHLARVYLRPRLRGRRMTGPLGKLCAALGRLFRRLRRSAAAAGRRIPLPPLLRQAALRSAATHFRPALAVGPSARDQVVRYYLSLIHRADREGFPRRPSQTPREYHTALAARLPEVEGDVQLLTEAFVQARYSPHGVEADRLHGVRTSWQRVWTALRRIGKSRE